MLLKIKTFGSQINYTRYEKIIGEKIIDLEKIHKFTSDHFFDRTRNFRFNRKKTLSKLKIFIFHQIYAGYEKNVRKQNCLYWKDLQLRCWTFFYRSYIFLFIQLKSFFINKKFNFRPKIYEIRKKCPETKLFILNMSKNLVWTIFS